jgi:hypothetical protein
MMDLPTILPAVPEIFLAFSGLMLLMVGVLRFGAADAAR